ncbi:hypothetical protein [Aromatoleum buckelii]|uniref:Type II secretion system protein GspC N-terminal domain-containing protein n=1 Tax=Aromatoleum buckelii TaxID=200254 RepID=A0ABX1N475_9RHOO|nr:hypothetical protein [Aromatoleum buckelii]MCK0511885.1 hypothetical protein [Aromatoleum buckelii]
MIAPITRYALLLSAIIAVGIVLLWQSGEKNWAPPQPRSLDESLFDIPKIEHKSPEEGTSGETRLRPLFISTRRASPESERKAEEGPDPFADIRVLGLFASDKEGGAVLLVEGKPKRVRYGDKIGPWALQSVDGTRAVFVGNGGKQTVLQMRYLTKPAPGSARANEASPESAIEGATAGPEGTRAGTASESAGSREEARRLLAEKRRARADERRARLEELRQQRP